MKIYRGVPFIIGNGESRETVMKLLVGPCLAALRDDFEKQELKTNQRVEFFYVISDKGEDLTEQTKMVNEIT